MTDKVKVKSYYRDGDKVSAHTRSLPGSGGVKISQVLASSSENNPEDTLVVKEALQSMGYYEPPKDIGMHSHPDSQLFDAVKDFQRDNGLKVDGIIKPDGETEKAMNESLWGQTNGAMNDMYSNYTTMKKANTKNTDSYYHCKANYEATQRGKFGEITAIILGNEKEAFDYLKNRARGLSAKDAINDYDNDLNINKIGRNKAKNGLYSSSIEACEEFRPRYLEKKYW